MAFVVLHYGDLEMTVKCLGSFGSLAGDVYLVLNGRLSGEEERTARKFHVARAIVPGSNTGFAGGVNAGIRAAIDDGRQYVMILNNDILLGGGFAQKLEKVLGEVGGGVCFSPLIMDAEGSGIWFAGARLSLLTGRAVHIGMGTDDVPEKPLESDYLTGCALCFPSLAAQETGLLDESFFLYWEDADWSMRLRERGYKLMVFPELVINHVGSASSGLESDDYLYYYTRNQLRFLFRHCRCFLLPFTMAFLALNTARMFAAWALFHGPGGRRKIVSVLKGVRAFALSETGERRKS